MFFLLFVFFFLLPILSWFLWRFFKESQHRSPKNTALLITGCDSGIGHHACLHLLQKGVTVFAGCLTESGKTNLEKLAEPYSKQLYPFLLDVTQQESIDQALKYVEQNLPETIDNFSILNNAGIGKCFSVEMTPIEDFRKVMEVNYFGLLAVTKTFLPLVRKSRKTGGRIINLTSIAGRVPSSHASAYSSSKFAAEAFSDALRIELIQLNIPVVVIEPSFIQTPLVSSIPVSFQSYIEQYPALIAEYGGRDRFNRIQNKMLQIIEKTHTPIEVGLDVIYRAYISLSPHTRYQVGGLAKILSVLSMFPSEVLFYLFPEVE